MYAPVLSVAVTSITTRSVSMRMVNPGRRDCPSACVLACCARAGRAAAVISPRQRVVVVMRKFIYFLHSSCAHRAIDSYSPIAPAINAQTAYAIIVPLRFLRLGDFCAFHRQSRPVRVLYWRLYDSNRIARWNKEIKRPDRPVGQRAIEKNKMRAMSKNAGYPNQT